MVIKCPECDARVEVKPDDPSPHCEYCGTPLSVPRSGDAFSNLLERVFEDMDGDGTPDLFKAASGSQVQLASSQRYIINGKQYSNVDELPPEARQALEKARNALSHLGEKGGPVVMTGPAAIVTSPAVVTTTTTTTTTTTGGGPDEARASTETTPAPASAPPRQLRREAAPLPAPVERTPSGPRVLGLVIAIIGVVVLGMVAWFALR